MVLQVPKLDIHANIKMLVFVAWACYGVIPTLHWTFRMGGFENPLVAVSNEYRYRNIQGTNSKKKKFLNFRNWFYFSLVYLKRVFKTTLLY